MDVPHSRLAISPFIFQGGRPAQGRKCQVSQVVILYPVFVQVLLTVLVYCLLLAARARAIKATGSQRGSPSFSACPVASLNESSLLSTL